MQYKLRWSSRKHMLWLLTVLLIAVVTFLCGCDSPERKYRDFISEMDILTRLDLCFMDALLNKADLYTKTELNYIKADLQVAPGGLPKADAVSALFTQTADMLLKYMDYLGAEEIAAADAALAEAHSTYIKAKNALYNIMPEEKNV